MMKREVKYTRGEVHSDVYTRGEIKYVQIHFPTRQRGHPRFVS